MNNSTNFRAVIEHSVNVASTQNGFAILFVNRGQVEEVVIYACFFSFREEGGDEVALAVKPAFRRRIEHGGRCIAKECGGDSRLTAINVIIVEPNRGDVAERILYFRRVERQFASNPFVVIFEGSSTEHGVFEPVGHCPTGCGTGFDSDTPRGITVRGNRLGEGHHFIPSFGNGIASGVKFSFRVENERFAVCASPNTSHHGTIRTLHCSHIKPRLDVVLGKPIGVDDSVQVYNLTFSNHRGEQTGLREVNNIRGIATIYADGDGGFKFFRAFILNINAGCFFKSGNRCVKFNSICIGEGTRHGDDCAVIFTVISGDKFIACGRRSDAICDWFFSYRFLCYGFFHNGFFWFWCTS